MLQQIQRYRLLTMSVALLWLLVGSASAQDLTDIRITEVNESEQWVELLNTGSGSVDISSAQFCANFQYPQVQDLDIFASDETGDGDLILDSGEYIALQWEEIDVADGDIALYIEGPFSDSDNIIDYVRWGSDASEADREDVAVGAGIWTDGDFVEPAQQQATIAFLGDDAQSNDNVADWDEGNPTPAAGNVVLPVELTSFDAVVNGADVRLAWTTASETNNAGFEVQHRQDGTFQTVGFVEGAGTTSESQHYQFQVQDLAPGEHAFRLKQLDVGGGFEFSPTVEVGVRLRQPYTLSNVHPNPSPGTARLTLAVRSGQTVRVNVYDALGRHVQTVFEGRMASGQMRDLNVNGDRLSSGVYFVRIVGDRFRKTRKLVITE